VYTHTEKGALRSMGRNVVVTVLTRKSSLTALLVLTIAAFRGKVTPSIVGASAGDRAQLTCRNGRVLVIIVFNVGDAPCVPITL
jgi:uncharacterized membrane protein